MKEPSLYKKILWELEWRFPAWGYRLVFLYDRHRPRFMPAICQGASTPHLLISYTVRNEGAMTAYHFDYSKEGKGLRGIARFLFTAKGYDPNRENYLCPPCGEEYYGYWKERWDEYNSGRL